MFRRVVLALAVTAQSALGQVPFDSAARWIDSIFVPYAVAGLPGCAVGVTRDGSLAFSKAYGMADMAVGQRLDADTRFYIASLSKQFTAMSIVLLAQDHRLSLDDSVRRWIPELPSFGPGKTITLRQLLNHTSGLRDYMTLLAVSGWPTDGELTEREFLDLMRRQRTLNFSPGDEFLYSNTGYALLSIVVKRASGQSLRDFAAARIFTPLGMTETEFRDDHTQPIAHTARSYVATASGYRESEPRLDVVGDAGVYSTVRDLAKWDANFADPVVGGREAITLMTEPARLNDGEKVPYGFALALGEMRGMKTIAHNGSYGGYRTTMLRFPEVNVGVITLCNTSTAPPTLAEQVGSLVLGVVPRRTVAAPFPARPAFTPYLSGAIAPSPIDTAGEARRRNDQLAQLAGSYYSDELDLPVTLVARDGALFLRRPKAPELRFGSFTTDLFTTSDKMLLRVVRGDNGAVAGFTLTIDRVRDLEFTRRDADHGSHTP